MEDGWGPKNPADAATSTQRIPLDPDYARRALALARRIVDEVEAELGSEIRKSRLDWFS